MKSTWKYRCTPLLFLVLSTWHCFGQNEIAGRISNREGTKFIPFVSIHIHADYPNGEISNIEGYYKLVLPPNVENADTVSFSCVGYKTLFKTVGDLRQKPNIRLRIQLENLNKVVIRPTEDPAYALIEQAVKRRDENRPESLPHFKFTTYNKANIDVARTDSIQADLESTGFRNAHLFMLESATEVVYQKPGKWKETVLKKKISGISNPTISLLSNSFQPFTCYSDYLNIAGFDYLNPLSPNSGARYYFTLRDTVKIEGDTVFVIHFSPRENASEELMEGTLSISAKNYALVNFRGRSTGLYRLLNFEVRQAYAKKDSIWFPHESNTTYRLTDQDMGVEYIASSSTFIRNLNLEYIPKRGDFGIARVNTNSNKSMPDSLWSAIRNASLTPKEKNTYAVYDTLPKKVLGPLNWLMSQSEAMAAGRLNFGPMDLMLNKFFDYNPYEGFRLGAGLATSQSLVSWVSAQGYLAYGFKDKEVKYGGGIRFFIQPEHELEIGLFYRNDVNEPGHPTFARDVGFLRSGDVVHSVFIRRMNPIEQVEGSITLRPLRGIRVKASFVNETRQIQLRDYFNETPFEPRSMIANIARFELRYAPGESLLQTGRSFIPLKVSYPRIRFSVGHAIPDILDATTTFTRAQIQVEHELSLRGLGTTRLFGFAAKVWGNSVAFPYLYFGRGNRGKSDFGVLSIGYFQTMGLYEFISDSYVQTGFIHNFGSIFGIEERYSKPELKLAYNAAIGTLSSSNEKNIPFEVKIMDHPYLEGGLIIDNILRLSNTFYYGGYGLGVFYRHGYYESPKFADNLSFIFSFAISL